MKPQPPRQDDVVLATLKRRYFLLLPAENIGHTPELTREIDNLEQAIRELQKTQPAAITR